MDLFIVFFRDIIKGPIYYLYLILGFIIVFYSLGIIADRRRAAIAKKLKEKKTYDIESGREAAIAAMETKQVLDVDENNDKILNQANDNNSVNENTNAIINATVNSMANTNDAVLSKNEEKAPTVMVLNSSDIENTTNVEKNAVVSPVQPPVQAPSPVQAPPVVIDSSSITINNQ